MRPPAQIINKLDSTPTATISGWIFCKEFQKVELAKSACSDWLSKGTTIKASSPPAQRPGTICKINLECPENDFLVSIKVKISGATSKIRLTAVRLREMMPVSFNSRAASALAKVMSTKPAHSAKKASAALLFKK